MRHHLVNHASVQLVGTQACHEFFKPFFASRTAEIFVAAFLDPQLRLKALITTPGNADSVDVATGDIVRLAVEQNASGLIMAHNHPSGRAQPSRADIAITRSTAACCEMLHIELVDHLVYTDEESYSFRQNGHFD